MKSTNIHAKVLQHNAGLHRWDTHLRQQVREDPEAASKQNPGGHSDEASDEKDAEDDDDERHGHIQSHQLYGPGRQREHCAQCDAQEGQPA